MNDDTHLSDPNSPSALPQSPTVPPLASPVVEPTPPPMPSAAQEPQGSFIIADNNATIPSGPSISPLTPNIPANNSLSPQMTVEQMPDLTAPPQEPQPQPPEMTSPLDGNTLSGDGGFILDPKNLSPQETVYVPPPENSTQFVPQGLVSETQPPVSPPIQQQRHTSGRNPLKWLLLFLLLIVIGVGVFFGITYGGKVINSNKQVTITYWGLWEDDSIIRPVIDKFEAEYPNIKVNYEKSKYQEYRPRLQTLINQDEGPDVFRYHATWIPMLRNEIEPVPEDIMSPDEFKSLYYEFIQNDLLADTTLWGIPISIDGLGLYINEDLFASAGVSVPTSYQDLLTVVPRLTVLNGNDIVTSAIALGTTNNVEHFSDILGLLIMQNGGSLRNPTGEEANEAMMFYKKFATMGDPLYTWNEFQDNSVSAFANGRVAMMIAPSWRAFDVRQINPNLRFKIEPVPQLPGSNVAWASYWVEGVSSKSKYKEQAFTFLKYLTSQESVTMLYDNATYARLFGPPYALKSLGQPLETHPFLGAYIKQAQYARSFPIASKTHDQGLNDDMILYVKNAINEVLNGGSPEQALQTMSQGFTTVLSKYGLAGSQ